MSLDDDDPDFCLSEKVPQSRSLGFLYLTKILVMPKKVLSRFRERRCQNSATKDFKV